ncbi:MAG: hypothetical protein VYC17_02585 [Nitrospinota bacterium]|nr:hypothetical protein [Nitrospinota bacterium]
MTRAFGRYGLWNETFSAVEYQELSIASHAMTQEEYFNCRELDLIVEAIYEKVYTLALFNLLKRFGLT